MRRKRNGKEGEMKKEKSWEVTLPPLKEASFTSVWSPKSIPSSGNALESRGDPHFNSPTRAVAVWLPVRVGI